MAFESLLPESFGQGTALSRGHTDFLERLNKIFEVDRTDGRIKIKNPDEEDSFIEINPVTQSIRFNRAEAATLLVDSANALGDVTYTAATRGTVGNDVRVAHVDPGANDQALSVSVDNKEVTVSLATDGTGTVTSTAAEVATAVNADTVAAALVSAAEEGAGTGVVLVQVLTNLAGGTTTLDGSVNATGFVSA